MECPLDAWLTWATKEKKNANASRERWKKEENESVRRDGKEDIAKMFYQELRNYKDRTVLRNARQRHGQISHPGYVRLALACKWALAA